MFSPRTPADLRENRIAVALRRLGPPPFDLTVSNPTRCGIPYPEGLLSALADPAGLVYRPEPRGMLSAREAIATEFHRQGVAVDPARIVLTASTSEAYAFLFKLLCAPGEGVLAPSPSYPLFEHLARLEGVELLPYRLEAEAGWRPDLSGVSGAPASARAVVVVHPNNPTGSWVEGGDRDALAECCAKRAWALIADEVFLDYSLAGASPPSLAGITDCLTFTLGGLSKSVGLPQVKLAWIAVSGPDTLASAALERLEVIADSFLSVATPVQLALPELLARGGAVREALRARCRGNLATLARALGHLSPVALSTPGGGWSAVVRVPAVIPEEELVLDLLERDGVAVHPGYFFDFPPGVWLVLSLLPEEHTFSEATRRLVGRLASHLDASSQSR